MEEMELQTDEQTTIDMWTDKEGERQTDGWIKRQTDVLIDRWRDKEMNRQEKTDGQIRNRQIYVCPVWTSRQVNRQQQTYTWTNRKTDRRMDEKRDKPMSLQTDGETER